MLRERGATVQFVCREQEGHLCDLIGSSGFGVARLSHSPAASAIDDDARQTRGAIESLGPRPDWLVVDHYGIDSKWHAVMRPFVRSIMVIDDLADRPLICDLLLDQNFIANPSQRFSGLLPPYCLTYYGPEYVLLREEFRAAKRVDSSGGEPRLLLFFGGGDFSNQTEKALAAVVALDRSTAMDVVVAAGNPRASAIAEQCSELPRARFVLQAENMASLMAGATVCLGAGGISTFERLFMGLPSIVVATAENQREPLEALARLGVIDYLGDATAVDKHHWIAALEQQRTRKAANIPFAVGSRTDRVIDAMFIDLVPFSERHVDATFRFLQDTEVLANFAMAKPRSLSDHQAYWQRKLASGIECVFAIERDGAHVGNCGIRPVPNSEDREGWIYLAQSAGRRSGAGESAFRRLLRVAFEQLDLPRLHLHVRRDNTAALNLYHKVGFRPSPEPVDPAVWGQRTADMCKLTITR